MIPLRLLLVLCCAASAAFAQNVRPLPVERVVVISVDGLRPDLMLYADTPVLHGLMKTGTYTMWARTTAVAITLPSHASMLTGVIPRKHRIDWNRDLPLRETVYSHVPTLLELATKAGYTTAIVAGKSKFRALAKPGTVDHVSIPPQDNYTAKDADVAAEAIKLIEAHQPEVMFIHFPSNDSAGHRHGWGSPEQRAATEEADRQIGHVLSALERAGVREIRVVPMLVSSHSGHFDQIRWLTGDSV
ncbi:MAG TPA: alkaline phosphatase family protein, partial [Opitutus sp.]|nr:alkaline phosphatase family protein [Opitutus sp.]